MPSQNKKENDIPSKCSSFADFGELLACGISQIASGAVHDDNGEADTESGLIKHDAKNVSVSVVAPFQPVVIESGGQMITNVAIDCSRHVTVDNHHASNSSMENTVAIGDSVISAIGKLVDGMFNF